MTCVKKNIIFPIIVIIEINVIAIIILFISLVLIKFSFI